MYHLHKTQSILWNTSNVDIWPIIRSLAYLVSFKWKVVAFGLHNRSNISQRSIFLRYSVGITLECCCLCVCFRYWRRGVRVLTYARRKSWKFGVIMSLSSTAQNKKTASIIIQIHLVYLAFGLFVGILFLFLWTLYIRCYIT